MKSDSSSRSINEANQQLPPRKGNIPVVLIIYSRPEMLMRVFQAVREARPVKLYIIADGPKDHKDRVRCQETRRIIDGMNWDCAVKKNYSETNLGLRRRVISGLDWVFESEESAIILEEDCLPHATFFPFCEDLLAFYKDDRRVMHISGDGFFPGRIQGSYYFSRIPHISGWATWKRSWGLFHRWEIEALPLPKDIFQNRFEPDFWLPIYEKVKTGKLINSWGYQWALTCMAYRSQCIMPAKNLVSHIGMGADATNIKGKHPGSGLPVFPMEFPLRHPRSVEWNDFADRVVASKYLHGRPIWEVKYSPREIINKLKLFVWSLLHHR